MTLTLNRRDLLGAAALSAGAITMLKGSFLPSPALAQEAMGPGDVVSFTRGPVTFHTYISPARAVSVTSHIVEFEDQLLLVDSTMLPPTATELAGLIASTGKPIGMA
ncbi:MAG: twin-arginine translocation signal domain-containing protein, partial [Pseudomonadota bacterium]